MADNFTTETVGVAGKTFASDEIGGTVHWPFTKLAHGPRDTANEVDDAATKRLPVKVGDGLGATSVLSGQVAPTTTAAAFGSVACRRVRIKASPQNTELVYIGPATVTAANGYPLAPGHEVTMEVSNLNILQHIAAAGTQSIAYIGEV